ncbi:MAG: NifU family protein [bacterium]|nr:NifU family protein [bacterium]
MSEEIINKIKEVLEKEVAPALAMDGGGISFVDYSDGVVKVKLEGACQGCPGAVMTLKMGVEARLKDRIPEIKEVISC